MTQGKMVRPDSKGRVTLGELARGVSGFLVTRDENNRLILEPYAEIPAREKWLFSNKDALESVKKGLNDAAAGNVSQLGDFTQYMNDDND